MSPTHIWVLEVFVAGEWLINASFTERSTARIYKQGAFGPKKTRIRKYVPA